MDKLPRIRQLATTSLALVALDEDGRVWHYLHAGTIACGGPTNGWRLLDHVLTDTEREEMDRLLASSHLGAPGGTEARD